MTKQSSTALFIGHGSPMNTLELNQFTTVWREMSASLPKPRAIISISAHWHIEGTAVTAMANPRTIHDFWGFPDELLQFEYPAPGDTTLARDIVERLSEFTASPDDSSWGLDHGTWSVLAHLYPEADIPVVQVSIDARAPFDTHLKIGSVLSPFLDEGIMVLGSGNVVHNLSLIDWSQPTSGFDWAHQFDEDVRRIVTTSPANLSLVQQHGLFKRVAPTPEHFMPLLYVAGISSATGKPLYSFAEGCAFGSLSMTSYVLRG